MQRKGRHTLKRILSNKRREKRIQIYSQFVTRNRICFINFETIEIQKLLDNIKISKDKQNSNLEYFEKKLESNKTSNVYLREGFLVKNCYILHFI